MMMSHQLKASILVLISGIPLFFSLYGSPFTALCSKNRFCLPEICMGRMLSDETKATGYVTPGELVFPNGILSMLHIYLYCLIFNVPFQSDFIPM